MRPGDGPLPLDPALWQAGRPVAARPVLRTGHTALDAALADGGWPCGALSELLPATPGIGELPLLLPALAAHAAGGGWVVLVSPPWVPCIGAWQAAGIAPPRLLWLTPGEARTWLWSTEQAARTAGCAVLAWPQRYPLGMRELRRLQLAAQEGGNLVALLRDERAATHASPAALRLVLTPRERGQLQVEIRKQRGGFGGARITLAVHERHVLPRIPPWQLPVHRPAALPLPGNIAEETPHALAGDPPPAITARGLDTQCVLPRGGGH